MISLEDAQEKILAAIEPLSPEEIPLPSALGRYLAASVHSPVDLPPADNSAMDGYAVRAADLAAARADHPIILRLSGRSAAGNCKGGMVEPGLCARIFTGAPLPHGADAVVMQEDVKYTSNRPDEIILSEAIKPWENVRLRGEDLKRNALLAGPGELLNAQRLGLLAASGMARAQVARRPVVGLIATGDELVEPDKPLAPGMIYESNRAGLSALAINAGALPKIYPLAPDDLGLTKNALQTAFTECDLVVTSGGVSVGERDFVKQAFAELGGELDFWKVSIRPGKPFAFGRLAGKLLFGLPGNPVSAAVTFFLLVRPALLRLQGAANVQPEISWGILAESFANHGERRLFARVIVDSSGQVKSAGGQASHMLSSMALSNGLMDVPPGANWPAGARVPVLRWS